LLHKAATKSTWSERFDPEVVPQGRHMVLAAAFDASLATVNFGEFTFQALR
jgi:hypothetical protein